MLLPGATVPLFVRLPIIRPVPSSVAFAPTVTFVVPTTFIRVRPACRLRLPSAKLLAKLSCPVPSLLKLPEPDKPFAKVTALVLV